MTTERAVSSSEPAAPAARPRAYQVRIFVLLVGELEWPFWLCPAHRRAERGITRENKDPPHEGLECLRGGADEIGCGP